jgi:hypothetical protein
LLVVAAALALRFVVAVYAPYATVDEHDQDDEQTNYQKYLDYVIVYWVVVREAEYSHYFLF